MSDSSRTLEQRIRAATTILSAEIDRLRAERDAARASCADWMETAASQTLKLVAAQLERDALLERAEKAEARADLAAEQVRELVDYKTTNAALVAERDAWKATVRELSEKLGGPFLGDVG